MCGIDHGSFKDQSPQGPAIWDAATLTALSSGIWETTKNKVGTLPFSNPEQKNKPSMFHLFLESTVGSAGVPRSPEATRLSQLLSRLYAPQ